MSGTFRAAALSLRPGAGSASSHFSEGRACERYLSSSHSPCSLAGFSHFPEELRT